MTIITDRRQTWRTKCVDIPNGEENDDSQSAPGVGVCRYPSTHRGRQHRPGLLIVGAAPAASATRPSVEATHFATFGSGLGSGSTIGPGGDLYVTDGNAGTLLRINRTTGDVSQVAEGLPAQVVGIGGAMDVAFIGSTAYVLVTLVGGDVVGGPHIGDDVVGIYRLDCDGGFTPIADIGAWSVAHPPTTDYFITTGVQYSLEVFRGGFLVTDGHHNRVLRVTLNGAITEVVTYGNIVPTGLERAGNAVYVGQLGPVPHVAEDGKVAMVSPRTWASATIASGASMIVDVESLSGAATPCMPCPKVSGTEWERDLPRYPTPAGSSEWEATEPCHP